MRLAFCGNVFPAEDLAQACAVWEARLPEVAQRWRATQGTAAPLPGFGLYWAAAALRQLEDAEARARYRSLVGDGGWSIWTANAFPFGGFHAGRVKERAFLPDWRDPARLAYTVAASTMLAELMPAGSEGSVSSCPLGYGPDALADPVAAKQLRAAGEALDRLADQTGVSLTLALEPEPDGAFERVPTLARWLAREVDHPRVGVCWDLCHSAVVGESAGEVLDALRDTGVKCGKVQVSAALRTTPGFGHEGRALLALLGDDRYFHQARAFDADGSCQASWPDLPVLLDDAAWAASYEAAQPEGELRVHCHVPLHRAQFAPGLEGTEWRAMLRQALAAGIRDFEVETYTLPVLPGDLGGESAVPVAETVVEELSVTQGEIGLDTARTGH